MKVKTTVDGKETEIDVAIPTEDDGKKVTIDGVTYVLQDHVNKLVGDARTEGRESGKTEAQKAADKAAQEAAEQKAAEEGSFKTLWEQEKSKREEKERELTDLANKQQETERAATRDKVAAKHKLPPELAELLKGETEADLEAHAAKLAPVIKPVDAADTQTGRNQNRPTGENSDDGDEKPKPEKPAKPYVFQTPGEVSW